MIGIFGFFRFHRLRFVKSEQVAGDIHAFYFEPLRPLNHTAGQHSLFFLPGLRGMHIFSLANAPDEKYVMIATHLRESSRYKRRLKNLKKGEVMWSIGPVLNFVLKPGQKRHIFLAQGIGITPFRSILVHAKKAGIDDHTKLIHVDKDDHPFRAVTSPLASKAHFPTSSDEFKRLVDSETQKAGGQYYISGSMKFISSTIKFLRARGVKSSQITADRFLGY